MTDVININEDRQLRIVEINWLIRPRSHDEVWLAEVLYSSEPRKLVDRIVERTPTSTP